MISHPPPINGLELRTSVTLRFRATAAATLAVTYTNLLDAYLVATTATAGSQVFQTCKIRRVQLWATAAVGTPVSVSLEFSGVTTGVTGDQQTHSDTSMGIQPAHVSARPNARSLAADYQLPSAAVAFTITVPAGGVIDVECSYRGQFNAATACAQALVGAVPGAFYLRGLDGLAVAATNFIPEYGLAWM